MKWVSLSLALLLLAGCGQKAALYHPPADAASKNSTTAQ